MAMTPEEMRIEERQLDDALRTIAAVPAPEDLPSHVLSVIEREAHGWWQPLWRPALVAVVVGLVALTAIAVWRLAPSRPVHIVVSRMDPAPHPTSVPDGPAQPRTSAPGEAQGSGRTPQGSEVANVRIIAPLHPRTPAPSVPSAPSEAEGVHEVPALDPPEPLTIARLETPELSERQLQMNALHIPALEVEALER